MITWHYVDFRTPPQWKPYKSKPWFGDTAPHIRGKVRVLGNSVWFEVINTRTGDILATDNIALHTHYGSGLPDIVQACVEATAAARGAWTYNFKREALK